MEMASSMDRFALYVSCNRVQISWEARSDVIHHKPLKTFHGYGGQDGGYDLLGRGLMVVLLK